MTVTGAAAFDFGAVTIGGGANDGITLNTSGSATFTFDSLSITNDNGKGLQANTAGTINIGGGSNTISSDNGAALEIVNSTIGNGSGGAVSFVTLTEDVLSPRKLDDFGDLRDPLELLVVEVLEDRGLGEEPSAAFRSRRVPGPLPGHSRRPRRAAQSPDPAAGARGSDQARAPWPD